MIEHMPCVGLPDRISRDACLPQGFGTQSGSSLECHVQHNNGYDDDYDYLCKLITRPLSAISDLPLSSLDRYDLIVPRSRTSTSQQWAFASTGKLLWNCLPDNSLENESD